MTNTKTVEPFVISRVFDAPRDRVWQAWTEAERLKQWFAPPAMKMTRCTLDLRPGGLFHYCLRGPDGKDMWGRWAIREVARPSRLVFIVSFSDENAGMTRHPGHAGWPLQLHSTVLFEAQGGKTKVTVQWLPHEATPEEIRTFEDGRDGMKQGWGGTLDYLEAYLPK